MALLSHSRDGVGGVVSGSSLLGCRLNPHPYAAHCTSRASALPSAKQGHRTPDTEQSQRLGWASVPPPSDQTVCLVRPTCCCSPSKTLLETGTFCCSAAPKVLLPGLPPVPRPFRAPSTLRMELRLLWVPMSPASRGPASSTTWPFPSVRLPPHCGLSDPRALRLASCWLQDPSLTSLWAGTSQCHWFPFFREAFLPSRPLHLSLRDCCLLSLFMPPSPPPCMLRGNVNHRTEEGSLPFPPA